MLKVVIIDEELPYPANSGKRLRSLNLTTRLARTNSITYVAHTSGNAAEDRDAKEFLSAHGVNVILVDRKMPPKSGIRFYSRLAANLVSTHPYSVQSHVSRAMQDVVRQIEAAQAVDLWHVEWTPYAQNVRKIVRRPWVVMAHNIESQIWQRYFETEANALKRWYIARQLRKFVRFERSVFAEARRAAVVSNDDADLASRWFGVPRPEVVANGVDVDYFHPAPTKRVKNSLLFLGSLDWRPNLDAIDLLLRDIFPQVVDRDRSASLTIVGRRPPQWLRQQVSKQPNAALFADVADVRPFLRQCGLLVVPLRIGGGSRLKILEALACECPVVSTRIGAEGLQLTPDEHFVETADVSKMSAAIGESLLNYNRVLKMAERGRQQIVKEYSWEPLAAGLQAMWRSVVEPSAPPALARKTQVAVG